MSFGCPIITPFDEKNERNINLDYQFLFQGLKSYKNLIVSKKSIPWFFTTNQKFLTHFKFRTILQNKKLPVNVLEVKFYGEIRK